jgi:hypothetical protein
MTINRLWIAAVLTLVSTPLLAAASEKAPVRAATFGELIEAKGTSQRAEVVTFGADLVPALLEAKEDGTVRVADWPVGPDARADVILRRREVYAPGAKVIVVDGKGWPSSPARPRTIPRSGCSPRSTPTRARSTASPRPARPSTSCTR